MVLSVMCECLTAMSYLGIPHGNYPRIELNVELLPPQAPHPAGRVLAVVALVAAGKDISLPVASYVLDGELARATARVPAEVTES